MVPSLFIMVNKHDQILINSDGQNNLNEISKEHLRKYTENPRNKGL